MEKFSFVRLGTGRIYYILEEYDDDTSTVIGIDLSSNRDYIVFYRMSVMSSLLRKVDESFINIVGPLYQLRDYIMNGQDVYIEER